MKDSKVYLLYNTADDTIQIPQLRQRPGKELLWEYLNKEEFTIVYRPQSAGVGIRQRDGSVEGILFRRSSSLSTIENLFLARRCPLIKPLLSETEITRIQRLQDQCRKKRVELDKKTHLTDEIKIESSQQQVLETAQDLRSIADRDIGTAGESLKDKLKVTSPFTDLRDKRKVSAAYDDLAKEKKGKKDQTSPKDAKLKGKPLAKTKPIGKEKDEAIKSKVVGKPIKKTEGKIKVKPGGKEKLPKEKTVKATPTKKEKGNDSDLLREGEKVKKKHVDSLNGEFKREKAANGKKNTDSVDKLKMDKKKKRSLDEKTDASKGKRKSSTTKPDTGEKETPSKRRTKSEPGKQENVDKKQKRARNVSFSRSEKTEKPASSKKSGKEDQTRELDVNVSELDDKTKKSRKPSGKRKKPGDEDLSHTDFMSTDKSTSMKGAEVKRELQEGSEQKKKEGKTKSSLTSPTTKDKKQLKSLVLRENQSLTDRKSRKLTSIEYMIHYVLSNPVFIKMGWTLKPTDRTISRVVTFRSSPANPQTYCFRNREEGETKFYPSGRLAVKIESDGTGGIYYPNGSPAILIKNTDTGMRLTLYSNSKKDPLIKESLTAKVIGMFDSSGNGVVYDLKGNKILNFNQLEGLFNNQLKSVSYKWCWSDSKILGKYREKELLHFMAKEIQPEPDVKGKKGVTSVGVDKKRKSLERNPEMDSIYKEILAELPLPQPRRSKVKSENHNRSFKSIILKINEEMALRINGQCSVFVNFLSNTIFYRLDLGVRVDPDVVDRIEDLAPDRLIGFPCVFDSLLHLSPSLQELATSHKEKGQKNTMGNCVAFKIN